MNYIASETFNAKIANRHIPGTFMNVIIAFGNLSNEWHKPLILYSMKYVPYYKLVILGSIYSIVFLVCTKNWLMENEKEPKKW